MWRLGLDGESEGQPGGRFLEALWVSRGWGSEAPFISRRTPAVARVSPRNPFHGEGDAVPPLKELHPAPALTWGANGMGQPRVGAAWRAWETGDRILPETLGFRSEEDDDAQGVTWRNGTGPIPIGRTGKLGLGQKS
jgi:hypothetical protein